MRIPADNKKNDGIYSRVHAAYTPPTLEGSIGINAECFRDSATWSATRRLDITRHLILTSSRVCYFYELFFETFSFLSFL
jgi:hypothetical protein